MHALKREPHTPLNKEATLPYKGSIGPLVFCEVYGAGGGGGRFSNSSSLYIYIYVQIQIHVYHISYIILYIFFFQKPTGSTWPPSPETLNLKSPKP